jgi:hypothetical protein
MKPPVTTTVQPASNNHPRAGQSGYITGDAEAPSTVADDQVAVKWDSDGAITVELLSVLSVRN